jgi:hypothetical protein
MELLMQLTGKAGAGLLALVAALTFMPAESGAQGTIKVAEAKLGKGVHARQITEAATTFAVNEKAYLWMRIDGGSGQIVKVVWHNRDNVDTVSLNIGGSPWRTWSSRTLATAGDWKVTVTDANDQVLNETSFKVE